MKYDDILQNNLSLSHLPARNYKIISLGANSPHALILMYGHKLNV